MQTAHKTVTDSILAQLRNGATPWVKPWRDVSGRRRLAGLGDSNLPHNATSGHRYSGANIFLLWGAAFANGWQDLRFLTYKQAQGVGGHVRKGERGNTIYFVSRIEKTKRDSNGAESIDRYSILKAFTVFNVDQCDGLPDKIAKPTPVAPLPVVAPVAPVAINPEFREFVDATGARITHGGNVACYSPAYDAIAMPAVEQFETPDSYCATLAHELGHWTGSEKRLAREFGKRFGDSGYAAEELVAELTAAIVCAEFGMNGAERHAGYIDHWIRLLENHDKAFFAAAAAASRAVDFMRGVALESPAAIAA